MPRGAKTSTPVVVGKGIPKLLPSLKIVVDDEDGRFRGRKLVEREGRERDRRGDNASSSIETPVLSLLSPLHPSLSLLEETGQVSLSSAGREGKTLFAINDVSELLFSFFFLLDEKSDLVSLFRRKKVYYRIIFREFQRILPRGKNIIII